MRLDGTNWAEHPARNHQPIRFDRPRRQAMRLAGTNWG